MLAFGGAGPVHAIGLARKLGCANVVIPPLPGVMSSFGLLVAPIAFERGRPVKAMLDAVDLGQVAKLFQVAEDEARDNLPEGTRPILQRFVDLRYHGQDHTLEISTGDGAIDEAMRERWSRDFVAQYHALYGKIDSDNPIELANVRVILAEYARSPDLPSLRREGSPEAVGTRKLWSVSDSAYIDAPVYKRSALPANARIEGPAIVEERESTTVIAAGDVLAVNDIGCLVVTLARSRRGQTDVSGQVVEIDHAA